jgi:ureidoglycolate lyase
MTQQALGPQANVHEIPVRDATPERLAPFGVFLGSDCGSDPLPIDFYGGTVAVRRPGVFRCDSDVDVTVCRLQPRPLELDYLERHPYHTQAFIPLSGRPFLAVFAPATADNSLPAVDALEAFRFDGSAGFMMFENVWHDFPFAEVPDTDIIVLLSTATTEALHEDKVVEGEAVGTDIEKRNLQHRYGVSVRLSV